MIDVLYGAPNSARSAEIDRLFHAHAPGALLVVPTRLYARRRTEALLAGGTGPGAWGRPVWTFLDLAVAIIQGEGLPARQLETFDRRLLVERCVRQGRAEGEVLPGLVTHLLRTITQLKQEAIEPEEFAARVGQAPDTESFDLLIAETYARFQEALKEAAAYDVPGLYWQARTCCLGARPAALAGVRALLFDGFDDFTPSEFRLLEALAPHLEHLAVGLHYEDDPDRKDVYALSSETLVRLRDTFQVTPVGFPAPRPDTQSAFAASKIFWRTRPLAGEALQRNLELAACGDRTAEAETIARKIKHLVLHTGAAPHEIAVVYPNLQEAAATLRVVFREYQIPMHCTARPALAQSCLGTFVRRLLEARAGWERDPTVEVLASPLFKPAGCAAFPRELAPAVAREAGIVAGAAAWHEQLKRLKDYTGRGKSGSLTPVAVKAVANAFVQLHKAATALPEMGTLAEQTAAFEAMLERLGVNGEDAGNEQEAHRALRLMLSRMGRAGGTAAAEQLDLDAFLKLVLQGLKETTYVVAQARGGVLCTDAASVRNLRFKHVFFAGLNEGRMPAPPAGSALYTHADLARLQEAGIRLPGRQQHAHQQRLLFAHVLHAATERLTLSWRMYEGGREAAPSHFVLDVQELFPQGTVAAPRPAADSFLGTLEDAGTPRDVRNLGYSLHEEVRAALPDLFADLEAPIAVETERQAKTPFEAHDGCLSDPGLVAILAERFGPEHQFSTNQLEQYLGCPFSFFTQRVLRIVEPVNPGTDFEPMLIGTLMHTVLQRFHKHYAGIPTAKIPADAGAALLSTLVDEVFEEQRDETSAPEGVVRLERHRMLLRLGRYLEIERKRDLTWAPTYFEVCFGRLAEAGERDPLSKPKPLELVLEELRVKVGGKIDRIDLDGISARIVDYKSGLIPTSGQIAAGTSLQLSLYALALERVLLPAAHCAEACYLRVGRNEQCNVLHLYQAKMREARVRNLDLRVAESVRGMRAGRFAPVRNGGQCRGCGSALVCRHHETRIARKTKATGFTDETTDAVEEIE